MERKIFLAIFFIFTIFLGNEVLAFGQEEFKVYLNPKFINDPDTIDSWRSMSDLLIKGIDSLDQALKQDPYGRGMWRLASFGLLWLHTEGESTLIHERGHRRLHENYLGVRKFRLETKDKTHSVSANYLTEYLYGIGAYGYETHFYTSFITADQLTEFMQRYSDKVGENPEKHFQTTGLYYGDGLNRQQYASEELEGRFLQEKVHPLHGVSYFDNMRSALFYGGIENQTFGDPYNYIKWARYGDVRTSMKDLKYHSQIPKILLSRTSWVASLGVVGWLLIPRTIEENWKKILNLGSFLLPKKMGRIFMPDFATYLTSQGVTWKTTVPWKSPVGIWQLSAETNAIFNNVRGKAISEISLKYDSAYFRDMFRWSNKLVLNLNGRGFWNETELGLKFPIGLEVGVKYSVGYGFTYWREVGGNTAYFLKEREVNFKLYLKYDLSF